MKTEKQNEPQLSAEMEKRFDEDFTVAEIWGMPLPNYNGRKIIYEHEVLNAIKEHNKKVKHFLATALEEQRLGYIEQVNKLMTARVMDDRFLDTPFLYKSDVIAIITKKEQ